MGKNSALNEIKIISEFFFLTRIQRRSQDVDLEVSKWESI